MADLASLIADPNFNATITELVTNGTSPIATVRDMLFVQKPLSLSRKPFFQTNLPRIARALKVKSSIAISTFNLVQALNVYFVLAEGFLVFMMQLGFALVCAFHRQQ